MRSRGRAARLPEGQVADPPAVRGLDLAALVVRVESGGWSTSIDLSDLPCARLVRPLAEAVAQIMGPDGTSRCKERGWQLARPVRRFAQFVDTRYPGRGPRIGLGDLTGDDLDAFEQEQVERYAEGSREPRVLMEALTQLMREAERLHPGLLGEDLRRRVAYASRSVPSRGSTPLDAYRPDLFEQIKQAALADVRAIRDRIALGEAMAAAGSPPTVGGPHIQGKLSLENVLAHVVRTGPLGNHSTKGGMSIKHWGVRWGGAHAVNANVFLTTHDIVPLLILLICLTGLEPECAKSLDADCLVNPSRGYVSIRYRKNRSRSDPVKTLRVADGGALHHPGGLIRLVLRLTERARELGGFRMLWVDQGRGVFRETFRPGVATPHILDYTGEWVEQHSLTEGGKPLVMDLRRLRKSVKSAQYRKSGGFLPDFAQGHSPEVAAAHYAAIPEHRDLHEQAVIDGAALVLEAAAKPPIVLDEAGGTRDPRAEQLPPEEVDAALSGQADVFLASCRDFYGGTFGPAGKGCPAAFWGCLGCANAVYTTRHLPAILRFVQFMEAQRTELSMQVWAARFERQHAMVTRELLPQFDPHQVALAATIAQGQPDSIYIPPEAQA